MDVAAFYNHYHDLFDEEITGTPFLEDNPAPTQYLLPAQFRKRITLGTTQGRRDRPGHQAYIALATESILFISYDEHQSGALTRSMSSRCRLFPGPALVTRATLLSALDLSKEVFAQSYLSVCGRTARPACSRILYRRCPLRLLVVFGMSKPSVRGFPGRRGILFQPYHPEYAGDPGPLVKESRAVATCNLR